MLIANYVSQISSRFNSGISREHSYRGDLESLIREIAKGIEITNEPANVTDCGNPDYVITRKKIPVGYIEAKDIGKYLNSKYIGGYQPAQKWLKDRNGLTLSFEDILHYQKIIVALTETGQLMKEIDLVGVE